MVTTNDPRMIAKLLRAIANAERAKQEGTDALFIAAAELLEQYADAMARPNYGG